MPSLARDTDRWLAISCTLSAGWASLPTWLRALRRSSHRADDDISARASCAHALRGRAIGGLVADANADADWLGVAERSGRGTRERERVCTVSKGAVSVPIRRVPLDASHLCACRGDRAEAVRAALRSL